MTENLGSGFAKSTFIQIVRKSGGICFRSFDVCRIAAIMAWVRSGCRGVKIVAVRTSDLGGSAVIAGGVIRTRGRSTDRSSTDSSSTNAHGHAWAYTTVIATTVSATAMDAMITTNATVKTAAANTASVSRGSCIVRHMLKS